MTETDSGSLPAGRYVDLPTAISVLRADVLQAMSAGTVDDPPFEVSELEIEFEVEVSLEATGNVRFWVPDLNSSSRSGYAPNHRVKVKLTRSAKPYALEVADSEGVSRGWDEGDQPPPP